MITVCVLSQPLLCRLRWDSGRLCAKTWSRRFTSVWQLGVRAGDSKNKRGGESALHWRHIQEGVDVPIQMRGSTIALLLLATIQEPVRSTFASLWILSWKRLHGFLKSTIPGDHTIWISFLLAIKSLEFWLPLAKFHLFHCQATKTYA